MMLRSILSGLCIFYRQYLFSGLFTEKGLEGGKNHFFCKSNPEGFEEDLALLFLIDLRQHFIHSAGAVFGPGLHHLFHVNTRYVEIVAAAIPDIPAHLILLKIIDKLFHYLFGKLTSMVLYKSQGLRNKVGIAYI